MDSPWVWRDEVAAAQASQLWPPLTTTLSVGIAVDHVDTTNGAMEIWPGSHGDVAAATSSAGAEMGEKLIVQRRREVPPTRLCIPKGAAVFRDARLWHRGVPNFSSKSCPLVHANLPPCRTDTRSGAVVQEHSQLRRHVQEEHRER